MVVEGPRTSRAILVFGFAAMCYALCLVTADDCAFAQSFTPPTARVIGHVFCADTNAPARLARVTLAPVFEKTTKGKFKAPDQATDFWVTTDTDGGFSIEQVEPGLYYVIADLPGYLNEISLSPERQLANPTDQEKLWHPSTELMELIDKSFPKVQVYQGQTAQIEIRLQRGAAVSGRIRHEDGSPTVGITIQLRRLPDKDGKQSSDAPATARLIQVETTTDDLGRYRISGLPAGKFIAKYTVRQASQVHQPDEQAVDFYSGGAFRERDATPIKLASGSEVIEDFVVPPSKIYRISGVVTSLETGHPINAGGVDLIYSDDGSKAAETKINFDGSFHFGLVPKGEYQLQVFGADVEWVGYGTQRGTPLQTYENATQPLSLLDRDITDLVVQLKPKPKSSNSQ